MRPPALLFALLAVATAASGAGVYRWVDEKGVTHFSELPPPGQQAPKPRKPPEVPSQPQPASPASSDAGRPAGKSWQEKEAEFRQRQIDRDTAARKQEQDEAAAKRLQRDCLIARKRFEEIEQRASTVWRYDDKGSRVYLNDEERTAWVQKRKQEIEANCAGR